MFCQLHRLSSVFAAVLYCNQLGPAQFKDRFFYNASVTFLKMYLVYRYIFGRFLSGHTVFVDSWPLEVCNSVIMHLAK